MLGNCSTATFLLVFTSKLDARLCAESIAFYSGEHREAAIAGSRLEALVATSRLRLAWEASLSLWQNGYTCVRNRLSNAAHVCEHSCTTREAHTGTDSATIDREAQY